MARYFTVEICSRPLARDLTTRDLEAWADAVLAERDLAAAACGADLRRRTADVIACVDVTSEELARNRAIAAFCRAVDRAGLGEIDRATISVRPDGSEPLPV